MISQNNTVSPLYPRMETRGSLFFVIFYKGWQQWLKPRHVYAPGAPSMPWACPTCPIHPAHLCHVQNWQASEGFCLSSTCLFDPDSPLSPLQTLSFPYSGTQAPLSSQWCLVPVWDHMSHRPQLSSLRSPKIFPLPPQEAGKGSPAIGQCKVATWCPMWVPAAHAFGRR